MTNTTDSAAVAAGLLSVSALCVDHPADAGRVRTVDGVSFNLLPGETLGIVGESGSGKSQTALALMGLLPSSARIGGSACFDGIDLLAIPEARRRAMSGSRIAMIFQNPMSSLNPYLRIGLQLAEVLEAHRGATRAEAMIQARQSLDAVQISDAARRLEQYPHELSGGMRQRVMIAMAIISRPRLLIADEPTTALDPTVQAQILRLLMQLRGEMNLAILLISHDLGLIAESCDRVQVMYAGRSVEDGDTRAVLSRPRHPYTAALLRSRPGRGTLPGLPLDTVPGQPPDPARPSPGCRFAPRCTRAQAECRETDPIPRLATAGGSVQCLRPLAGRS